MTTATFNNADPVAALRQWRARWLPEALDARPWPSRCGYEPDGVGRERRVFGASREHLDDAREVLNRNREATRWGAVRVTAHGDRTPSLDGMPLAVCENLHIEGAMFEHFGHVAKAPHKNAAYRRDVWFLDVGGACLLLTEGLRARRDLSPSDLAILRRADSTIHTVVAERDAHGLTDEDRSDLKHGVHMLPLELLAAGLQRAPVDVQAAVNALGLEFSEWAAFWGGKWQDLTPSRLGEKIGFSDRWADLPARRISEALGCSPQHAHAKRSRLRTPWSAYSWICAIERRRRSKGAQLCPVCDHIVDRLVGQKAGEPSCRPCYQKRRRAHKNKAM